jgi:hypothetical protein
MIFVAAALMSCFAYSAELSGDLSVKVVPATSSVPAGAAAAGFTTLALSSDFTQQMPAGWLGGCVTPGNGKPVDPQYYWDGQPHTWWMNIWWAPIYQNCTVSQVQDPTFAGLVLNMPWTVEDIGIAIGTVIQSGSWDYDPVKGKGTVHSYPNNAYYEITARITPLLPGAYFVLHTWPPAGMSDANYKGGHELDVIETSGNELWKYDAGVHNWRFGKGGAWLWLGQVPAELGGLPANYDPSVYHTFGLRATATGEPSADGSSMGFCSYIDNVLIRCVHNLQGVAPENTTERQFLVLQNACDWWNQPANGCEKGRDQRLYVKSVRVFSCGDWNTTQCNRPVLMGAP